MLTPQVPVAKEGYPFIFFFCFFTLISAILGFSLLSVIGFIASTFAICFFRDPERFTPDDKNAVICPADGKIIVIEDLPGNNICAEPAKKISIFMNVFNVHVNRMPCGGTISDLAYKPGKFYSADSDKGALHNEYCAVTMHTESGKKIVFVQIAGLIARRIVCWLERGDSVTAGKRFGLIRFGSRVDLYLPPESSVNVQLGQKVRAGETIIAHLD